MKNGKRKEEEDEGNEEENVFLLMMRSGACNAAAAIWLVQVEKQAKSQCQDSTPTGPIERTHLQHKSTDVRNRHVIPTYSYNTVIASHNKKNPPINQPMYLKSQITSLALSRQCR